MGGGVICPPAPPPQTMAGQHSVMWTLSSLSNQKHPESSILLLFDLELQNLDSDLTEFLENSKSRHGHGSETIGFCIEIQTKTIVISADNGFMLSRFHCLLVLSVLSLSGSFNYKKILQNRQSFTFDPCASELWSQERSLSVFRCYDNSIEEEKNLKMVK